MTINNASSQQQNALRKIYVSLLDGLECDDAGHPLEKSDLWNLHTAAHAYQPDNPSAPDNPTNLKIAMDVLRRNYVNSDNNPDLEFDKLFPAGGQEALIIALHDIVAPHEIAPAAPYLAPGLPLRGY